MKHQSLKVAFFTGLFGMMLTAHNAYAAAPTASSAVIKNATEETVEIEIVGTNFDHFVGSGNKVASPADLGLIIYNGMNPLLATIRNAGTLVVTFPISMGTGKSGGGLSIIMETLSDSSGNENGLINIGDSQLTDNADPLIIGRRTLDADDNGKVDGILFTASENLNDEFEGLTVVVSDYEVSTIETGEFPNDTEFVVRVLENEDECSPEVQLGCDTDVRPGTQITLNETLADLALTPAKVQTDVTEVTAADGLRPLVIAVNFSVKTYLGIAYNAVVVTYSEMVTMPGGSENQNSTADLGAMTTKKTLSGIGSWDGESNMITNKEGGNHLVLGSSGMVLTVFLNTETDSYFESGSVPPKEPRFTPLSSIGIITDLAGNPVNDRVAVEATNTSPWDVVPPTVTDTYSCDPDLDGDINRIQVTFSEEILDRSIQTAYFEGDNDAFFNNGEKPSAFNTATAGCDGLPDDTDANDNKVRFDFAEGIKGTDAAFLHSIERGTRDHAGNLLSTGDGLGEEHDMAMPVITDFRYEDSAGNDGRIDKWVISISETALAEKSMLSANDLIFTNTGDFVGAEFGSDMTNSFIADGMSVTIELGVPSGTVDTFENSGTVAIATQNNFVLEDSAGNRNDNLAVQSQAGFSDGAAPVIKTFGYEDGDGNGRIDQFMVVFSEQVTEASSLAAKNLLLTNPGDFMGADFGTDEIDLITEDTEWIMVLLGTEAIVEDDSEDSGMIAITSQNGFALSDGLNLNARRGAQSQAAFVAAATIVLFDETEVIINAAEELAINSPIERFAEAVSDFNDISGHWAESYINKIADKGIVSGKESGVFAPNDLMTRAELTKVAVNAFDVPLPAVLTELPFIDVATNIWYAPYITAAKNYGIIEGSEGRFDPNAPITRAEVLKILIEAAAFSQVSENYETNYASKPGWSYVFFPDVPIGQWYAPYIAYARDFEIVGGYDDGTFRPGAPVTRAEVAKIVIKVLDLLGQ